MIYRVPDVVTLNLNLTEIGKLRQMMWKYTTIYCKFIEISVIEIFDAYVTVKL